MGIVQLQGRLPDSSVSLAGCVVASVSQNNLDIAAASRREWRSPAVLFLFLVFILGGSSREDAPTLLLLRPLAATFLVFAIARLTVSDLKQHWPVFVVLALMTAWMIVSLVPLPFNIWSALPGRDIIADIDRAAGLGKVWRPLSMAPERTENALFAMLPPFAMACLLARLDDRRIMAVLPFVAGILMLSALVTYLQVLDIPIRFYPISTPNAGLMANRNHQALLLAILLLILLVIFRHPGVSVPSHGATGSFRLGLYDKGGNGLFLVVSLVGVIPLVLLVGSRAGLVLAPVALTLGALLWTISATQPDRRSGSTRGTFLRTLLILGTIIGAFGIGLASRRDVALQRLLSQDASEDFRFPIWQSTGELAMAYFPFGSGVGSFAEVYQVAEKAAQLRDDYVNHAHNDYLEIIMTAGLPGLAFLIVLLVLYLIGAYRALVRKDLSNEIRQYRLLGYAAIFLVLLASVVDYPLRVPAIACLMVFVAFLARCGVGNPSSVASDGVN